MTTANEARNAYMRGWNKRNKDKKAAADRKYREAHREEAAERSSAWTAANRERRLEIQAGYRERNRQKLRQDGREYYLQNRDQVLATTAAWKARNVLKLREYKSRRRANEIGDVDFEMILERDGLWCYLCATEVEPDDIHFDHVVPLSKGGAHANDNIKITHSRCNLTKGAKLLGDNR